MPLRPPSSLQKPATDNPWQAALDHEFRSEAAATHGRLLARLEQALRRLERFDVALEADPGPRPEDDGGDTGSGEGGWFRSRAVRPLRGRPSAGARHEARFASLRGGSAAGGDPPPTPDQPTPHVPARPRNQSLGRGRSPSGATFDDTEAGPGSSPGRCEGTDVDPPPTPGEQPRITPARGAGGKGFMRAEQQNQRAALVAAAGEALWYVTIQRDLMGFRNRQAFLEELNVPKEVVLRMGVRVRK